MAKVSRTAREAGKLKPVVAAAGADAPQPGQNYNRSAKSLLQKATDRGVFTKREAREAAWCLWDTKPALARTSAAVTALVKTTEASGTRQPFSALASSYLTGYAPDRPAIETISALLMRLAGGMGTPWAPLHDELNLFDAVEGPQNLARAAIERGMSPTELLSGYGLSASHAQSGFAKSCIRQALERIRDGAEPNHDTRLQRTTSVALRDQRELLFPEHGPLVAEALLRPFGEVAPEEGVTDKYLAILLRLFGDPRVQPARWAQMGNAADIVRRWLTKQSLRQFLEVVNQVADDRMFRHRRAFWASVFDLGLIPDAWVVLGPQGADVARRAFGKEISFATFSSGNVEGNQAVLLLSVGDGVVAEWSHNGRCIIWNDAEAASAPRLHSAVYDAAALRAPDGDSSNLADPVFAITHSGSETYRWQARVADKLHQMTGVRIAPKQYRVI